MNTVYNNQMAAVNQTAPAAPPEEPEIELIAYQVIRKPKCVIRVPLAVNGKPVKIECADPAAVDAAFRRFVQTRYDADERVRKIVNDTLAEFRAEEEAAKQ